MGSGMPGGPRLYSCIYHSLLNDVGLEKDTNKLSSIFKTLQDASTPPGNDCENLNTDTGGATPVRSFTDSLNGNETQIK